MSTVPAVTTVTRGTGLVLTTFAETAETFAISTGRDLGLYLDLADEAQSPWTTPAELFDVIGALLNEFIETFFLGNHSTWTDFGTEGLNNLAGATQIAVSASNIDDIILGIRRDIREANGQLFMKEYGVGFAWAPNEFQFLEMFAAANGFNSADEALKEGLEEGIHYLGADHYVSNDNVANHRFAGVKKVSRLGILTGTYGQAHVIPFPAGDTNTFLSGTAYYSRVDVGRLTPTNWAGIVSPRHLIIERLFEKRGEILESFKMGIRSQAAKLRKVQRLSLMGVANFIESFAKCLAPEMVMI